MLYGQHGAVTLMKMTKRLQATAKKTTQVLAAALLSCNRSQTPNHTTPSTNCNCIFPLKLSQLGATQTLG
jgi:hypothetical protein